MLSSIRTLRAGVCGLLLFGAMAIHAQPSIGPWDKADLFTTPKYSYVDDYNVEGVQSLFYEGLVYHNKVSRFYAYYSAPDGEAPVSGWPAVVLVHGGGGTASAEWVEQWNKHGYAAISMDLEGNLPARGPSGERPRHAWSTPKRSSHFEEKTINWGKPVEEHWFYHAIGGVIRAACLLHSFPEVDSHRIGIEGFSWGGVLTSVALGVDPRFKFGITHTGCGFLHEGDSYFGTSFRRRSPDKLQMALAYYEPSSYLHKVTCPVLRTSSPTDSHFPLVCEMKSAQATQGPFSLWIKVGWGHAARPEKEPYAFADSVVKGGPELPKCGELIQEGNTWSVSFTGPYPLEQAELCYTLDTGLSKERQWHVVAAKLDFSTASAELPEGTRVFYFNVSDSAGRMASSLIREL